MNFKKMAIVTLCVVLLFVSGIVPDAFANWYDDISGGRDVEIKGNNYAVDYFCGVPALYNKSSTIYCNELVERFYREAYGLDVDAGTSGIKMLTEGYKFVTPSTPKPGDVVYVSAAQRGTYDHWAIVKSYNGTHLTLFEQNVKNGGMARIERQLKYPSNSYNLYTPVSEGEKPDPVLKGMSAETTKAEEIGSTNVTTTAITTTKPTTTTPATTLTTTSLVLSTEGIPFEILKPSVTNVVYGDCLVLRAEYRDILQGETKVLWSVNNNNFEIIETSADGRICIVTPASSGDTVFVATLINEEGNAIASDTQEITSEAGFFQKLIAFFKRIFGLTEIFIQSI